MESICCRSLPFAMEVYKDDPCSAFEMKGTSNYNALEKELGQKMHKAISIIQFKLEGQLIRQTQRIPYGRPLSASQDRSGEGNCDASGRKGISDAGYRISDD